MSNWNKIGKPIVVLCLICVVITGASISSSAVNDAVNFAIAAYNAIS